MLKKIPTPNFSAIRKDFPLLVKSKLAYLDSAASAQKPQQVIDATVQFYKKDYANIHRGIYELSARASRLYEEARQAIKQFVNAKADYDVIFVRGTTEGINLVAQSYLRPLLKAGDEIILSEMEHHSNIVPWHLLAKERGAILKVVPITDTCSLNMNAYQALFSARTKLVALTHVSNAIGTINDVAELTKIAHQNRVPVLIDGAQAVSHLPVNLDEINCDFYTFSGHKLYGPTGIGVLLAKSSLTQAMPPYQGGGDMIETVAFSKVTYAKSPQKFEAGTPDIAGVIGLNAAIEYMQDIGMQAIYEHEQQLLSYAESELQKIKNLKIIGTAKPKVGVISFVIDGIHPHDIGTVLDQHQVAVRAGHHCAMPLMERLSVPATVRASLGVYSNKQDIDAMIAALKEALRIFN